MNQNECAFRLLCHSNCNQNWWCNTFFGKRGEKKDGNDLQQPFVEKVLDADTVGKIPLDKE